MEGCTPGIGPSASQLLQALTFLPTSAAAAQQAGEWRYQYARRGLTLSTTDAMVAATAYEHDATLVTANEDDYPMPEISVVSLPRLSAPGKKR